MCAAKMGRCKQDHWDFKPISSFFLIIHVKPPDFKNIFKSQTYLEAGCLTKTNIIFDQLITTNPSTCKAVCKTQILSFLAWAFEV